MHTVHSGVDVDNYEVIPVGDKKRNIGFISQMSYANGVDILVDAFIQLRKHAEFSDVSLVITGGYTGDDKKLLRGLKRKIKRNGLESSVDFHRDFDQPGRADFFRKVSLVSVPVREGPAFGLYLLEAMASGVPVVQPELGAFPEIVGTAGGGVLYPQNDPGSLADALAKLLKDPDQMNRLSKEGRKGVDEKFNIYSNTEKIIQVFRKAGAKD